MQINLFERLRLNDLIHHSRQRVLFTVVGSYAEGTKIQIGRFERIETANLKEWCLADDEKTPVSKKGIVALQYGDVVVHKPTNINYLVGEIAGNYAYCSYTHVLCDSDATEWHLHAKSNGIRPV